MVQSAHIQPSINKYFLIIYQMNKEERKYKVAEEGNIRVKYLKVVLE